MVFFFSQMKILKIFNVKHIILQKTGCYFEQELEGEKKSLLSGFSESLNLESNKKSIVAVYTDLKSATSPKWF